ncbi:MAG: hypothetical protein HY347_04555 [candidate division NC10 bacterium]|nr:hypothetical protein [candidate division NC10 bacterium]
MRRTEQLLARFRQGVQHPEVSGFEVLELLDTRSALAQREEELSEAERRELEAADSLFLTHVQHWYESVGHVADLEAMRRQAAVPPSHWWWYLETLVQAMRAAI